MAATIAFKSAAASTFGSASRKLPTVRRPARTREVGDVRLALPRRQRIGVDTGEVEFLVGKNHQRHPEPGTTLPVIQATKARKHEKTRRKDEHGQGTRRPQEPAEIQTVDTSPDRHTSSRHNTPPIRATANTDPRSERRIGRGFDKVRPTRGIGSEPRASQGACRGGPCRSWPLAGDNTKLKPSNRKIKKKGKGRDREGPPRLRLLWRAARRRDPRWGGP